MPTIVFDVRDPEGASLANVEVVVDGQTLLDHLTGTAVAIDPGMHTFIFDAPGRASVQKSLLVQEGEKEVRVRIAVGPLPPPSPARMAASQPAAPPTDNIITPSQEASSVTGSSQRRLALFIGAGGLAAAGVGSIFGLLSFASSNSSHSECSASTVQACPDHRQAVSDHDSAVTEATLSTLAFVVGGVALAGGAYLFFTAPKGDAKPGIAVAPLLSTSSGGVKLHGTF
jgi:hypothetical protein